MFGFEKARELFLKFGFQNGYTDFIQMKLNYSFDSEMDLLLSGPVIHTWEGIVQATPKEIRFDRKSGDFLLTGTWINSYEAEQHLTFNKISEEPVCWSLTGYASGWSTAFFEKPLLAIEPNCMGMGDDNCEWLIKPPSEFGDEARIHIDAYKEFWKEVKMGIKLMQYYKYMSDKQGLKGKMQLATETNIPSTKAALAPDSRDNIEIFKEAVEKLTGQPAPDF